MFQTLLHYGLTHQSVGYSLFRAAFSRENLCFDQRPQVQHRSPQTRPFCANYSADNICGDCETGGGFITTLNLNHH